MADSFGSIEDLPVSAVDDFYKMIGANVKRLRVAKGMTQMDLSYALGFKSVGLVSQAEIYLKGQHFNLKHLFLISHILKCDVRDFLEPIESSKEPNKAT